MRYLILNKMIDLFLNLSVVTSEVTSQVIFAGLPILKHEILITLSIVMSLQMDRSLIYVLVDFDNSQ